MCSRTEGPHDASSPRGLTTTLAFLTPSPSPTFLKTTSAASARWTCLPNRATRSAKGRLRRSTRKQSATKQRWALGLHQNRSGVAMTVAGLMPWKWLLFGAIGLIVGKQRTTNDQYLRRVSEKTREALTRRRSWRACRTLSIAANLA